jgi:cellulose synthase/poly-beta-1,6-N-acetylglucosamine synthase-like glycosyltransferase
MSNLALSVVIIGRNEGERLRGCLESVRGMAHPFGDFEIIYVDSCSSDGSAALAAELGARMIELKDGKMCAARARNAGWQIAKAPFILFLDGDTILDPNFAVNALAEFENQKMMVVYGQRREIHTEASIYNRIMDLEWIIPPGLMDSCGGDAVFRGSVLERTGGFNPELIAGEEPDLCRRIRSTGGLILRIDVPMTGHDLGILTWRQYWRRAMRTGHAFAELSSLSRNTKYPMWLGESRRNIINGSLYSIGLVAALAATAIMHSWLYIGAFLAILVVLVLRTAVKFRWKSQSRWELVLFGVHSHVQHIPILFGQIKYWIHTKGKSPADLIEYKTP